MPCHLEINKNKGYATTVVCLSCKKITNHIILTDCKENHTGEDDDIDHTSYQIIRCNECDRISFREVTAYYHDAEGEELYPRRRERNHYISDIDLFLNTPERIRELYIEVNSGIDNDLATLSFIGTCMLIEMICNDLILKETMPRNNLPKKYNNLSDRINYLREKRFISESEKAILHAFKKAGNQSARESRPYEIRYIIPAMSVIENIIEKIYINHMMIES